MRGWLEGHPGLPRLLAGLEATDGKPMTLAQHEAIHGDLPHVSPHELLEAVERSGLRGRGGADFPTARKLDAVARRGGVSAVVVNGSETEPASAKDRLLLSRLPHLVLDGARLAAEAVRAREVIIQVGEAAHGSLAALQGAISIRNDPVPARVVAAPQGYVAGEESAVVNYLNRGVLLPTLVPPRPFERGYLGKPTLIQNPETLAHVALVARFGEDWYRELGTVADPGSVLVTISGAVAEPGVYEMAFGTAMTDLLNAAGGATEPLQALLVGGYFGTWIDADRGLHLRLSREELRHSGCALGSGVLIALGESSCGLHESVRVLDYLAAQSAGQCGPCVHGLAAIAELATALANGRAHPSERERLLRWAAEVRGRGACHHPDGVARFLMSALEVFHEEIEAHEDGICDALPAGLPLGSVSVRHQARGRKARVAGGVRR